MHIVILKRGPQMQTQAFKIETNVPIPTVGGRASNVWSAIRALLAAPVGASVFFPDSAAKDITRVARDACNRVGGAGWAKTRSEETGIRVWKIAEPKARA